MKPLIWCASVGARSEGLQSSGARLKTIDLGCLSRGGELEIESQDARLKTIDLGCFNRGGELGIES